MLLDPINSITSIVFYRKVAKQTPARSLLYLTYLAFLFTALALSAVKYKLMPVLLETFDWLAKSAPPITFSKGQMSIPNPEPVTLRHPKDSAVAFTIDAARTEPLTPEIMEKERVLAYLTRSTFYILERPGELRVYDFSKAPPQPKPIIVDAEFYQSAAQLAGPFVYALTLLVAFFGFLAWKGLSSLSFAVLGMLLNSLANAKLEFGSLFNIAVYAQTLVIVLQTMSLFMPQMLLFLSWVSVFLTGTYIWLAIKNNQPEEEPGETPA